MNWLAHLYLSEPQIEFRLGNLLADVVRGAQRERMSAAFLRGVRCHAVIDAYTDRHAVVRRSRARIGDSYRRFSGVLVDVFYDHFLARDWERYAADSLEGFNEALREAVLARPIALPEPAQIIVERMVVERRLADYRRLDGIERALARISARLEQRFGRRVGLGQAASILEAQRDGLAEDFAQFFPQLQDHVQRWARADHPAP